MPPDGGPPPALRSARPADWPAILALNNAEVPKVGPLTADDRDWFLRSSDIVVVEAGAARLCALLVLLTDGSDYASPNYGWFAARYPSFAYVDRIVVHAERAGTGLGRALYDHAVAWSAARRRPVLTAEVNLDPPNDGSLAFHQRYGFTQVGVQVDPRNGQTEAMFALRLDRPEEPGSGSGPGSGSTGPPVH